MKSHNEENTDIFQLLAIMRSRKMVIFTFVIISQFIALVIYLTTPVRYTAQSQFIFKTGGGENPISDLAALVGVRSGDGNKSNISAYFDVILFTNEFIEKVLQKRWNLGNDSMALVEIWGRGDTTKSERDGYRQLREQIHRFKTGKYLLVEKNVRPGLVALTTRFDQAEIAYEANRYIVDLLNEYLLLNNKSQASENRKFIETRLKEVEAELKANEEKFLAFSLANQSISTASLTLAASRHHRDIEISQEVFLQLKKQVELAKIEERKEMPLIEVIASPQYPLGPGDRLGAKAYLVISMAGIILGAIFSVMIHYFTAAWRSRKTS